MEKEVVVEKESVWQRGVTVQARKRGETRSSVPFWSRTWVMPTLRAPRKMAQLTQAWSPSGNARIDYRDYPVKAPTLFHTNLYQIGGLGINLAKHGIG